MSEIIIEENSADEPPLSFKDAAKWLARIDPAKCRWQEVREELVQAFWRGELRREDGSTAVFTNDNNVTETIGCWLFDPLKGPYRTRQEYFDAVRDDSFESSKMEPIESAPAHCRNYWEPAGLYCWMDLKDDILDEYNSCDALAERPRSEYSEDDRFFIKKLRIERSDISRWWKRKQVFAEVPTQPVELSESGEDVDTANSPATYRTGTQGQPSSMHLMKSELLRRAESGQMRKSLKAEAEDLVEWLRETHPNAPRL